MTIGGCLWTVTWTSMRCSSYVSMMIHCVHEIHEHIKFSAGELRIEMIHCSNYSRNFIPLVVKSTSRYLQTSPDTIQKANLHPTPVYYTIVSSFHSSRI